MWIFHFIGADKGKIREKFKVFRKVKENQGTFSMVWKNPCFPDKIREFLFLMNICVASANNCT